MPMIGFVAPLLPGMTEEDRSAMMSCWRGERKAAYEAARRGAGITREAIWIQPTPMGDLAVVFMEADDVDAASATMGQSSAPFDQWFRDHVRQVHGISVEAGFPPHELILDYRSDLGRDQ